MAYPKPVPSNLKPAPSPLTSLNLVDELTLHRDTYLTDSSIPSCSFVCSSFPRSLYTAINIICANVKKSVGGDPGINLAVIAAVTNGHEILSTLPVVENLLALRTKFYLLDQRANISREYMEEVSWIVDVWKMFVGGGGVQRLQINRVDTNLNSKIMNVQRGLGIRKGAWISLCTAACLCTQESLSRHRRTELVSMVEKFKVKARIRVKIAEVLMKEVRESKRDRSTDTRSTR